ncbi:MAG TPA: glycosyltransferase family 2 protein [Kiritimatiellia bacterium]|nr:glycosyltransferase family 2 protein [Kiritimatiellia bacterium]
MQISVVVPVYNEQESISILARELREALAALPDSEIILADDGSTDNAWEEIQKASTENPLIRGIRSNDNRGQSAALLMGMAIARGDVIVTLDGDLQNNPRDIPMLVERIANCDVVCGYRANRKDTPARRIASRMANRIRNWVTKDGVRDTGCTLRAFRRQCVADLPPLHGMHRFIPAYFKLNGRRIEEVPVDHRARKYGRSKYTNLQRLPRTVFDLFGFLWYRRRLIARTTHDQVVGVG